MKNDKMGPVQGFAFGGIANPTQRATLRPSDRAYLEARQRELDAYERQRLAYNKALEDYQSREQTEEFRMAAPVLPFKEADVVARQQQAAQRARRDAGNRAVAIDVVSDPERFGFGSMSIADRFMAKGGEVRGYAEGGEVDEDDEAGVGEVGSAKALLAQLEGQGPRSKKKAAPALKRMAMSGGAAMPKPMDMSPESLASTRELVAMAKDKGTAKEQMAELARLYQLRAATFNQPTLTEQTLSKGPLATKRFKEGGEAKKDLPTVMEVRGYATEASERLFPDQGGQDDQRDAARHMLAGAALAKRYGPNVAKLLGLAHEYSSNPQTFFSGLGIGQPRDDFEYDEHNNRVGMGLASRATSREALEALVREMAAKASTEKREGLPYIMGQEKIDARAAKAAKGPAPRPQGYQKGGIVKALKGTKAVDEAGKPVTTYRGEYGASDMPSTQLGSYTFGSKDAANLYASSPNDSRNAVEAMKVFPAQLSIRKPLVNTPDDPFVDLKFLRKALGQKEFKRVVNKNADRIENTGAFEELADAKGYDSLQDLLEKNPKDLDQLYTEIFPILDDPKTVKTLQRRGYDGAIYGGSGATALEPEYRVFSTSQAISPFGNKPMSPRSARQQLGDLAQSMEISPTDALGFFGRAAGVAASALTPSSLNEGEDEELRRRQSKPATIDKPVNRAKGSPEEGEMMDPEAALVEGREDVPAPAGRDKVLDEILGAGETALTLGTGALSGLAGMPYGLYKGLTSGKYLEGKAADIAGKEAAAFMERNTYVPRTESAQENLAALAKVADKMKLAPAPGGAAIASIPRTAALAQAERLGMAAEKKLEGPVTRTMERGGKAADLLGSFGTQPSRVVSPTPAPATPPSRVAPPTSSVKTPAPASELGFYSAAEQAALNLPRKEGTGAAFLNDLMKAPDVKKEELSAMGLDEFLKSKPKATRQEVQDFIANNRFDVKEVQLGGKMDFANLSDDQLQKEYVRVRGYKPEDGFGDLMSREQIIHELSGVPAADLTKFNQYQLPGGENYREILLTIPGKKPQPVTSADDPRVKILGSEKRGWIVLVDGKSVQSYKSGTKESEVKDYAIADANTIFDKQAKKGQYKSPHFSEPNILAHLRVNDRVDADGKKMLLIEELQSDWHQTGREKGYGPKMDKSVEAYYETKAGQRIPVGFGKTKEEAEASIDIGWKDLVDIKYETVERKIGEGVPDAPFKDTWHQLALKRALKYAADNGYDRVGLTTGKQQTARFDLSKQLSEVVFDPASGYLSGRDPQGKLVVAQKGVTKESLPDYIGKEGAQKILEAPVDESGNLALRGVDLQVGGEGMKKYYDEIYPGFLAKQAKKYGSQVGETNIKTQKSDPTIGYVDYFVGPGRFNTTAVLGLRADGSTAIINQTPNSLQAAQQLANRYKEKHLGGGKEAVRYIDITPEMKGAVPYAKGGPVDKNTAFIKAHS